MLSENTLRTISNMFCGDIEGYYCYKSGPMLVDFFNAHFSGEDTYGPGFPSRWFYVYDKLSLFLSKGRFDEFLNIILNKSFLMRDLELTQVKAAEQSKKIYGEFNRLVQADNCIITSINGEYRLSKVSEELDYIRSGGYANVYKQKSTHKVIKKLKDEFLTDEGIRSRFKREFEITKSLQDLYGIIKVYTFDESSYSYTMEFAEQTLQEYISNFRLTDKIKINFIGQILNTMNEVHKRDIIHRDLSPNNIFIIRGLVKIADFGLGKDLNILGSHQTLHTNEVGQFHYCAPEQFMQLKDGDKRSDVFSLGRIINYIMTRNSIDSHHIFRSVAEKATNSNVVYRYADAGQLLSDFKKSIKYHKNGKNEKEILNKIARGVFDNDVETYIYELSSDKISHYIVNEVQGMSNSLIKFMKGSEDQAQHIIQSIDSSFREVCGRSFSAHDPFARFSYLILKEDFSFVVKEIAAKILRFVATDVNRFSAQDLVRDLKKRGIEPMLEEILDS